MVRITKIEIQNFRAFRGVYHIDLAKTGKNLLVYGENGSGKSSLYFALKSFLESSEDDLIKFENYQNIFTKTDEYEIPVYAEDRAYLEKAREYLDTNDYKACAIYVRTAFDAAIKQYCEKKDLAIKYRDNPRDLRSEDFWLPIKMEMDKADRLLLDLRVVDKIERARKFILNELSHVTFANIYRKELEDAIEAVGQLKNALA